MSAGKSAKNAPKISDGLLLRSLQIQNGAGNGKILTIKSEKISNIYNSRDRLENFDFLDIGEKKSRPMSTSNMMMLDSEFVKVRIGLQNFVQFFENSKIAKTNKFDILEENPTKGKKFCKIRPRLTHSPGSSDHPKQKGKK